MKNIEDSITTAPRTGGLADLVQDRDRVSPGGCHRNPV